MEDDSSDAMLAALEGLEPVVIALSQPGADFNRALHEQHIALARTAGLEDQEQAARIGLVEKLACGEGTSDRSGQQSASESLSALALTARAASFDPDVWQPLLADVKAQANLESEDDVQKLLALHELSVSDYLCASLGLWSGS
jgi:hypothetical protein